MGFAVKNTTRYGLLDWLCPHHCRGCGRLGELFCERCKNDILKAGKGFRKQRADVLCVGKKEGLLGVAVKEYKYAPVRAFSGALAGLIREVLMPEITEIPPEQVVIVPLPTVAWHVRQRGFDHMGLIGKKLARMGGWCYEQVLMRTNSAVQVGQDKLVRIKQAKEAYKVKRKLDSDKVYVLVDDVWTTGASMRAAAKELKKAGVKKIIKLVIAVSEND